jgi:hypothetical protein
LANGSVFVFRPLLSNHHRTQITQRPQIPATNKDENVRPPSPPSAAGNAPSVPHNISSPTAVASAVSSINHSNSNSEGDDDNGRVAARPVASTADHNYSNSNSKGDGNEKRAVASSTNSSNSYSKGDDDGKVGFLSVRAGNERGVLRSASRLGLAGNGGTQRTRLSAMPAFMIGNPILQASGSKPEMRRQLFPAKPADGVSEDDPKVLADAFRHFRDSQPVTER